MKKLLVSLLLLTTITSVAYSQWMPEWLLTSPALSDANNNKLSLEIDAIGFFKNNEYFSPISKGQTFPGIRFEPKLGFQLDNKIRFEIGFIGTYYSGDQKKDGLEVTNDIFARIQYAILPNMHLVFGNLYQGANHRLLEPLYRWENQLVSTPESGLQVLYEDERFFADVWVDWRRYIEHGDSVPEILDFGLSASAKLTPVENNFQLSIPLQLLIHHEGGQIDTSDDEMIVAMNVASGVMMNWKLRNSFIKSIDFDTYLLGYYDKLPNKKIRPYDKGWAVYPVLKLNAKYMQFMTGYWYAHKFYAFNGEPVFSSFNPMYPGELLKNRHLLTNKLSYFKQLHKSFSLGIQAESYYDMTLKQFDYSFGINLRLNAQVFSKGF